MSNCYVAAPYSVTYIISFPNFLLRWSLEISSCLFTALKFFFFHCDLCYAFQTVLYVHFWRIGHWSVFQAVFTAVL